MTNNKIYDIRDIYEAKERVEYFRSQGGIVADLAPSYETILEALTEQRRGEVLGTENDP